MLFPPSLPQAVISRAFHADNGELGILPADAPAFLDACQADAAIVLGWELWLIDHDWDPKTNAPARALGYWCGLIPVRDHPLPHVVHGDGDLGATRAELAELDLEALVDPRWLDSVRINFTLDLSEVSEAIG
jgi:hypothetical protein